ncbi:MAG TPA: methyltransferase domain-containing protein [Actinophytocola sp.]|uniref:SAM-dependent methyltransferase n=1 Tax=Actinophytocola sp. TaxID=1872138 RepID=UPI002DDC95BA|nr:methyltransferase domain-containing protein [Actinophytocola sp.]HEV2782256.1 methyltransferase domain-containing protein [Actinophytocola sp.]
MTTDSAPTSAETDEFYEVTNLVLLDVWGDNFHQGYWESEEDDSSIQVATERLTDLLIERSELGGGGRVLDIGCGLGVPALRLAEKTPAEVVGVSNNQSQIDEANQRAVAKGLHDRVRFDYADALDLPFPDGGFDVVWIFEALMHMDRPRALREARRVLRPGGRIVITDQLQLGPMTDENARLVREQLDLMHASPLLFEDGYRALVRESGLELVEFLDISRHTQITSRRVIETVDRRYDELLARYGEVVIPILQSFRNPAALVPELGYALIVARRPG